MKNERDALLSRNRNMRVGGTNPKAAEEDEDFEYLNDEKSELCLSPNTRLRNAKLHDALATTEFLLNLPLVDGMLPHERDEKKGREMKNGSHRYQANDDDDMSSLGSSILLDEMEDDKSRMSCSGRLRISMRSITKSNGGLMDGAFQPNTPNSVRSCKRSLSGVSLSSKLSIGSGKRSIGSKRAMGMALRRATTSGSIHSRSTRNSVVNGSKNFDWRDLGVANNNNNDDDNASKAGSINFPLRRSASTGFRFERTGSHRSMSSTDRLNLSLVNILSSKKQPAATRRNGQMRASTGQEGNKRPAPVRMNSGRSVCSFRSSRSMRGVPNTGGRAPRRNERTSKVANVASDASAVSDRTANLSSGEDSGSVPNICPRKARRRRSLQGSKALRSPTQQSPRDNSVSPKQQGSSHGHSDTKAQECNWCNDPTKSSKIQKEVQGLLKKISQGPPLHRSTSLDTHTKLKTAASAAGETLLKRISNVERNTAKQPTRVYSLDADSGHSKSTLDSELNSLQALVSRAHGLGSEAKNRGRSPPQLRNSTWTSQQGELSPKSAMRRSKSLGITPMGRLAATLGAPSLQPTKPDKREKDDDDAGWKNIGMPKLANMKRATSLTDKLAHRTTEMLNESISTMLEESMNAPSTSQRRSGRSPVPPSNHRSPKAGRTASPMRQQGSSLRQGHMKSHMDEKISNSPKRTVKKDNSRLAQLAALSRSSAGADPMDVSTRSEANPVRRPPNRSSSMGVMKRGPIRRPPGRSQSGSVARMQVRRPPNRTASGSGIRGSSSGRSDSGNQSMSPPHKSSFQFQRRGKASDKSAMPPKKPVRRMQEVSPRKNSSSTPVAAGTVLEKLSQSFRDGNLLDDSKSDDEDDGKSDDDSYHSKLEQIVDMDTSIKRRQSGNYLSMNELDRFALLPVDLSDDDSDEEDDDSDDSDDDSDDDSSHHQQPPARGTRRESQRPARALSDRNYNDSTEMQDTQMTDRRAARRKNRRTETHDADSAKPSGRPKLQRKLSNKDLAAAMNARQPSKQDLLKDIKKIQRTGRNLQNGARTNDASLFVTGSRIRRYMGGVEVITGAGKS
ncbi:expressed unknown protein [Seminavis robusta]|uniref:Uncharacterized protein n=1 Tax=Seminavis robusta TaxID=568900 RepID=A0A9N8HBM0_9STRA|nr:expressed unknown protein [Seminavis robusta]|eukprot:Sro344_g122200.1 n/a (1072) ;mRNA; f:32624-35839